MKSTEAVYPAVAVRSVLMVVLWPSFLTACVACGLLFSLVDPEQLILLDKRIQLSNLGVYTIGFFVFWLLGAVSSSLTVLLSAHPK
ncbi:hypothetical protein [Herminiimonas sp. CN]|uniref:hypothetical protein n=1 Tax=Herminiimonas sp. CN TaxID=1349818 RepID=UPI001EE687AC|nr:hypothetical protein [Herminiimonas sp. CN]